MANFTLNGKDLDLQSSTTISQVVEQFCKNNKPIIAELNGQIIKSHIWPQTAIKEGDHLELISIVGGG